MKRIAFFLLLIFSSCHYLQGQENIYVSTLGNDKNPGSFSKPLKTLTASLKAIRNTRSNNPKLKNQNVNIILRGGSYALSSTLIIEPADSNIVFKASSIILLIKYKLT